MSELKTNQDYGRRLGLEPITLSEHQKRMMIDFNYMKSPDFHSLSTEDRLFRVTLLAYLKLNGGLIRGDDIPEAEVRDAAYMEICNLVGDDAFVAWAERMGDENEP
jgi:hypothetical protein